MQSDFGLKYAVFLVVFLPRPPVCTLKSFSEGGHQQICDIFFICQVFTLFAGAITSSFSVFYTPFGIGMVSERIGMVSTKDRNGKSKDRNGKSKDRDGKW